MSGELFERPMSERLTAALDSSGLLPTPSGLESTPTDDYIEEMREARVAPHERLYLEGRKCHAQRTLSRIAPTLLPTPTANIADNGGSQDPEKRRRGGHQPSIQDVVEKGLLPTPTARDGKGQNQRGNPAAPARRTNPDSKHHPGTTLTDAASLWNGAPTEQPSPGGKRSSGPHPDQLTIGDA